MPAAPTDRLSASLPSLLQGAGVSGRHEVTKLKGDASNRSYFRVRADGKTFIAMQLAEVGPNSKAEEITKTDRKIEELPFLDVRRYLSERKVPVPELFGYDESRGILLLSDYGDYQLYDAAQKESQEVLRKLYEKALLYLERIAIIPEKAPRTSIAFARRFDRYLYNWEFQHFVECALDQRLSAPPKGAARDTIVSTLEKLTDEYLTWNLLFCHRDYHSKNLLVHEDGDLGVIDFQDALLGPCYYDLASLLRDSYVRLDSKLQDDLVESFRERMKPHRLKGTESRDAFRRAFDLMGMHRNLKAAGRFFYIDRVKKNPNYLPDVPRTLDYVEQTIARYDELKALRTLLIPRFPELKRLCAQ